MGRIYLVESGPIADILKGPLSQFQTAVRILTKSSEKLHGVSRAVRKGDIDAPAKRVVHKARRGAR